ncbi:MAG: pyridoxal phosphate-dependent aminotransferase [Xanthomonadales bacterium]
MAIARKMSAFAEKSSWIRKMFEQGAKMKAEFGAENVFDFSLGNPDVPPPPEFQSVLRETVEDNPPGIHGYMPNGGYPWVREALAARLSAEQGVDLGPGDVLMTCGAAGALNVVMKALLDPGDEIIILAPFFVEYHFYIDNHGGVARVVPCDAEFNPDLEAIRAAINERTKGMIINSPNNPTGQVYPQAALDALGALLSEAGERYGSTLYLVMDEPYRDILFDGHTAASTMRACRNAIVLSSWSKSLSLAGERIGVLGVHPDIDGKAALLDALTLANRILGFVNAPALMQRVVARLPDVSVDCSIYARRRALFRDILDHAGFEYLDPKGAFYFFPKSPIEDDVAFCRLLQAQKILAVPGQGFGTPGHFRLAFSVPDDVIERSAEGFQAAMRAV